MIVRTGACLSVVVQVTPELLPTPFDFNALGVTLNSFTPKPFGVGIVNPYLSVNSPMYREGSGFNGKPALLLVSQTPIHIIQREFTES